MKAIQFKQFGPPEVLELVEVELPTIADDELLIKVQAAGINPIDAKIRNESSFVCRQLTLPSGLGFDVSGEVAKCGKMVDQFKEGGQVFGSIGRYDHPSSYAEYCIAKPSDIVHRPHKLDAVVAAALPIVGVTAFQALHQHAKIQAKERVLIHAAAGGVGHIAVQLAKLAGAHVIATASSKHHGYLRSLRVDEVVDYAQEVFEKVIEPVDVVIDLVGGETGVRSLEILKSNGRLITVPTITRDQVLELAKSYSVQATGMLANINAETLEKLATLLAEEKLKLNIEKTFPLAQAAEAHRMIETKRTQGKIVLTVD